MAPIRFDKVLIADERYESAAVCDVNCNGTLDIVSGAYWYPGPDFERKHKVADIPAEGEYFDTFATVPMDVNGNGYPDIISGCWYASKLVWFENPCGDPDTEWQEHTISMCGHVETVRSWDVDGDGAVEIVPNTPADPLRCYKLLTDDSGTGTGEFSEHLIFDQPTVHGLGFGDVNGDGRGEFVTMKGWLEPPDEPLGGEWALHEEFDLGPEGVSVPIIVTDVNGDGLADLIVGRAHSYGLDWWEQRHDRGTRSWVRHPIDPFNSQYHDMQWADIDGDGQCELITGKRYRAHRGRDPGGYDPIGVYYFKWNGEGFTKNVIDYGSIRTGTGVGLFFQLADMNGDGRLDIIAPGKDGLYLFRNMGAAEGMGD